MYRQQRTVRVVRRSFLPPPPPSVIQQQQQQPSTSQPPSGPIMSTEFLFPRPPSPPPFISVPIPLSFYPPDPQQGSLLGGGGDGEHSDFYVTDIPSSQFQQTPAPRGMTSTAISAIPVHMTRGSERLEKCSICRDTFQADRFHKRLLCGHIFHPQCVGQWLASNASCPMCRKSTLVV